MTDKQEHILMHTLGLRPDIRRGDAYRNHYVAGEGHHSWDALLGLVDLGMMAIVPSSLLAPGDTCFCCTEAGKLEAQRIYHERLPKLTRSQARYRDWRAISDAYPDLTFGDFLKMGGLAGWRRSWGVCP